jgi:DNA polymerase III subunit epsilon
MPAIKNTQFVCLDVESTGLDCRSDRVIEVAAALFTVDQVLDEFESLVNPEQEISVESQRIHNISDSMVLDQPPIRAVLPDVLSFIGDRIIVGHGIEFDINILSEEAARVGIENSLKRNTYIDTLRLARLYGESPSNSLEVLRQHFNIVPEGAHRAKNDVLVNIQVFRRLTEHFKTTEQILEVLSKPIFMKKMPLGKHKGRLLKEMPLEYLLWAARQEFDQDLLFSLRTELQRRKKGGSFSQVTNPFAQISL